MKKRKMLGTFWGIFLSLVLLVSPLADALVMAEEVDAPIIEATEEVTEETTAEEVAEEVTEEVAEEEVITEEVTAEEVPEEVITEDVPEEAAVEEVTTEEEIAEEVAEEVTEEVVEEKAGKTTVQTKQAKNAEAAAEEVADPIPDKTPRLVYGNPNLSDEDAFVLLMLGDGFTADQQTKFFDESEKIADYVMDTSPWDEFTDTVKIYALGVVSNESGAKADSAINQEEANLDTRDTYFGASFWTSGMQRLLSISSDGRKKAEALADQYLPHADYNVIIVNATTYGGSGGSVCVASLNNESLEMMLHELGHTTSNLADEYFAGASYAREYANMTAESDPAKVRWARFIGKNGVGVYEYDNGGDGWYRPHQNCKMRFLGQQYAFCEVCKEQIRITFCQDSNVTKIFFQTYADMFYEAETGKDMSEYFIIRKNGKEATGDTLGDALTLTYKDADGNVLDSIPAKSGTYTVTADFAGNSDFDACSLTATYEIELPDLITLDVKNKVYDGEPAALDYTIDYDKEYTVKEHYTGVIPYAAEITYDYESDEAPITPGRYTVTLTAYDKETGAMISRKSKDYEITFKATTISNNDTNSYPGAMPYYNNKTIVFSGEGFTADEQDEFEALAKEYIDYIRSTEPFKEADLYFNYHTVETVSNESGIGSTPKDTYFKLSYDENGKIVATDESTQGAMYIGNNVITSYYKANIVIVNDKNAKEGTTVTNKRFTVYSTPDEAGMEFAANELTNYFTGQPEGYRPSTDEEYETERTQFLKALYYTWYGTDYSPIVSRAYDETFIANGEPIDLAPYFHTYILGKETTDVSYTMTYYADDNGAVGEQLDGAPSEPGTYHAKAELVLDENGRSKTVVLDDVTYRLPKSRGWTTYTILADEPVVDPDDPVVDPDDPVVDPDDPVVDPDDPVVDPDDPVVDPDDPTENPDDKLPNDKDNKEDKTDKNDKVKYKYKDKDKEAAAKTGDNNPIMPHILLLTVALVVMGSVIIKKRQNR